MTTLFCLVPGKTVYLLNSITQFLVKLYIHSIQFQLENKRSIESANRELERKAALFKHDLKEVRHSLSL